MLSDESKQILCGLAVAGGAVMLGIGGVSIAAGVVELATGGGNLALTVQKEKQDRCRKLLDGLTKAVEKSYEEAWKKARSGSSREDQEAALAQIDDAVKTIKPSTADIVDAGFNGQKLYQALRAKLPENSLFRTSHAADEVLSKIVTGTYSLIRSDDAFTNEIQAIGFERVLEGLDQLKRQGKKILEAVEREAVKASLDRQMKHEEIMAALAIDKGVPLENLRPVFNALELETPEGPFDTLVSVLIEQIEAIKASGHDPVEKLNDPVEVIAAIEAARARLAELDIEGALEVLRRVRTEQTELRNARARGEARLAQEEAQTLELAFRYDEALDVYTDAATLDPDNIWPHIYAGRIRIHRGNLLGAEAHFHNALVVANRTGDERDLMVANVSAGDIYVRKGDLKVALQHFQLALAAIQILTARDQSDTGWQRDLSVCHTKIGDVERARGNLDAALTAYLTSLAIAKDLAARDQSNTDLQRDLIISNVKLAQCGDDATKRYTVALDTTRELRYSGRLAPVDQWMIEDLETSLANAGG